MKKQIIILLCTIILIFLIIPAGYLYAQPNLITNGDFETGDFTGWTYDSVGAGLAQVTSNHANILVTTGETAEYQDISIASPNLAFSFDVRSDPNTMDNNYFVELVYYSGGGGGTQIANIVWFSNSSIPNWTTMSEPDVMGAILATNPSADLFSADTVRVSFGVVYNSAQYAASNFDNFILTYNQSSQTAEQTWVRTMPMMCQYVWINEDGHFQFKFLYPYADNNWVKIYAMNADGSAGELVFEADMPHMNPNLIVDLPDGMYIVMTFHDDMANPIQTFTIGKPAPDMEM